MAASSILKITFNQDLGIDNYITFSGTDISNTLSLVDETWKVNRLAPNQVTIGLPTGIVGERSAINAAQALLLDIGFQFNIVRIENVVRIEPKTGYPFLFNFFYSDSNVSSEILSNTVNFFQITNTNFSPSANACSEINVNVTTNVQAVEITSPFQALLNQNPFLFSWPRGQSITIKVKNASGNIATKYLSTPGLLSDDISLQINPSPFGTTVIATLQYDNLLIVGYSLDGITYQESNVFSGLASGDYTIYWRDQFGCVKNRNFHVDSLGINSPFFHISKSNSLRFAQRIEWGDAGNYKTDENTLSHEVDVKMPYCEIQQFQSSDVVKTQFKSNYAERIVKVINEDSSEDNIPIQQMTSNIGITDRRDARKFNAGNGKTGVYFTSGNTFDFITGAITGTYSLNGALPEWATQGNYFGISNQDGTGLLWFLIEEVFYDEVRNADVIIIDQIYTGVDSIVNVRSQYNRFNYEIFEFEIDMVNYLNKKIQVSIENNDLNFTDLKHLSEKIDVKVRHKETFEIRYWNSTNTDIVYATGIQGILRFPFTKQNGKVDEENETYKTDTSAKLLKSALYEVDEFVFEPVTKEIWRKLSQALSHDTVFIDGVGYSKNSEFDTEGPLEDSNLYVLKATMIKNGNVYSSLGNEDGGYGQSSLEIPGLIQTGTNGFLRY